MPKYAITPHVVLWVPGVGTCGGIGWGDCDALAQAIVVHSTDNRVVLGMCLGGLQRLHRLLGSSALSAGTAARNQGRQWEWPELVVCTRSVVRASRKCLCSGSGQVQTHTLWRGPGQVARAGVNYGHTGSSGVLVVSVHHCGFWVSLQAYSSGGW